MPLRNRKRPVGLKKLKAIIGHRGPSFARLVNLPVDSLKSIESGRLSLSRESALKIRLATGVDVPSLFTRTPKASHGKPYKIDDFIWWRSEFLSVQKNRPYARKLAEELGDSLGFWAKVLLLAAVEKDEAVSFRSIHLELVSALEELVERNELRRATDKVLEQFKIKDKAAPRWTKRKWLGDDPDAVSVRPFYNITAEKLKHLRDLDEVILEEVSNPLQWSPETVPAGMKNFSAVTRSAA